MGAAGRPQARDRAPGRDVGRRCGGRIFDLSFTITDRYRPFAIVADGFAVQPSGASGAGTGDPGNHDAGTRDSGRRETGTHDTS